MSRIYLYIGGVIAAVVVSMLLAWFIFTSNSTGEGATQQNTSFGSANDTTSNVSSDNGSTANTPQDNGVVLSTQKIFKISDGPVAGATFIQTLRPTTTVARYIMADNGHAFDLAIDSAGAVAKSISNTTIPGAMSAAWTDGGYGALLQYLDNSTIKTVYLGFPVGTSTAPVRLQFYPDGITSAAASPSGSQVVYLLRGAVSTDGYIAKSDGTGSKKLFSLPLRDVQIRWPSNGTLLAYSNSATGAPGIAFAIDSKNGSVTPLVYAPGITATADASFGHVLYQTSASSRATYAHSVSSGTDRAISFDPYPEKCIQSPDSAIELICATPLSYAPPSYLDSWHQGTASLADSLLSINLSTGTTTIIASPGGSDGGIATDMLSIGASPDGKYLLFVSKYDRSLWGVRL